jgi:hypothetical protein
MNSDDQAQNVYFDTNIHAGSEGETVKLITDLLLTGKIVQCVVVSPAGLRTIVPAVVSSDGTYAYINTTPSTFPLPGTYTLMLQIANNDGGFTDADTIQIVVQPTI